MRKPDFSRKTYPVDFYTASFVDSDSLTWSFCWNSGTAAVVCSTISSIRKNNFLAAETARIGPNGTSFGLGTFQLGYFNGLTVRERYVQWYRRWRTVYGRQSPFNDPCLRQYRIRLLMNHRLYIQVVLLFVKVLRFPFDRLDHYCCNCQSRKSLCNRDSLDPWQNFERNEWFLLEFWYIHG